MIEKTSRRQESCQSAMVILKTPLHCSSSGLTRGWYLNLALSV